MPNVAKLFATFGHVELVNGRTLTAEQVKEADALLVRSVTKVNADLLAGSSVKFVGTATIGVDHIDTAYLAANNIGFSSAPGCNADAVADYVFSGLSYLALTKDLAWLSKKIGIIGFGNVGQTVYKRFVALGCEVCVYDPFKSKQAGCKANFVSLKEVLSCDVISLHAPLTQSGEFPTKSMIGADLLSDLKSGATIVSAGRGGVIEEEALRQRYVELQGQLNLVWDVWQGEPNISPETLAIVDIATPHIAGYSKQGREKGTWMVYQAFCQHFNVAESLSLNDAITPGRIQSITIDESLVSEEQLARSMHAIYDVARDDARLRATYRSATNKTMFDWLRKHYVERDEFNTCTVSTTGRKNLSNLRAIGFQ